MKETIEQLSREFFEKLLIQIDALNINEDAENIYSVKIQTPDSHLLI